MTLQIKNLSVEIENKKILDNVNLTLQPGKINVLMGPNGSGKSTLAQVLMGNKKFKVTSGQILFNGEDIIPLSPNERAKRGFFLSFQSPEEIEGITISNFLRTAYNSLHTENKISIFEFKKLLKEKAELLEIDESFLSRYLNHGFSGGEKKKSEILQLAVLNPKFAILDETDSGLDIDALKSISKAVNLNFSKEKYVLLITHYKRILNYIKPDKVFIMLEGSIVKEGGEELLEEIESKGYKGLRK